MLQVVHHPPLTFPGENGKDMKDLLWFVLPSEVSLRIEGADNISQTLAVPFTPKDYNNPSQAHWDHTHLLRQKHGSVRSGITERRSEKSAKGI